MTPATETRYAKSGEVHIAYQVLGDGPLDLLLMNADFIPTDAWDEQPLLAGATERLASFSRLVRFDRRGVGLSDPITPSTPPTLEQWMDDAVAVLDTIGSERAALMAANDIGPLAILMAATHPSRVRALVLVNSYARGIQGPDYPWGFPQDVAEKMIDDTIDASDDGGWSLDLVVPSLAGDAEFRRWWDRAGNRGASPATARALLRVYGGSDVRDILEVVDVPTLILHRVDDRATAVEHSRYLAEHIKGAKLVELPGADDMFWVGDTETLLDDVEEFLTGERRRPDLERVLATVLFTDIVGSTERAAALGDHRWRQLLDEHDRACARQVERCRGRVVKSTGDGLLATFDGPARAISCALDIRDALHRIGIEIRTGIHIGEVELRGDDIGGIAVHIAARIEALAGAGQVLVSRTVTDLVAGSGIAFRHTGGHPLKGIDGDWQLYEVVP